MPQIIRTRSQVGLYAYNGDMNYNNNNCSAYSAGEKYNILRCLASNLLEKMYPRDCYSVRRSHFSRQMSK